MDNIEERLARLEAFIGNIDQIKLYANSLQEVIDKYLAPLYIEQGSDKIMLINDYLGDLDNIPHNVIFKIRSSHNLTVEEGDHAIIKFQRGENSKEYTLRKLIDGALVPLESGNYSSGEVYDVYINSQDVAVITANDTGVRALDEIAAVKISLNDAVAALNNTITTNCNNLDQKIDTKHTEANEYTDTKFAENKNRIDGHDTFLSGMTKEGNNYTFKGNIIAQYIETPSLRTTKTVNMSGTTGFTLPSGTTIADPSANLGLTNRQWVNTAIANAINNYHANKHIVNTVDASTALSGKENGTFYYKLSQ